MTLHLPLSALQACPAGAAQEEHLLLLQLDASFVGTRHATFARLHVSVILFLILRIQRLKIYVGVYDVFVTASILNFETRCSN